MPAMATGGVRPRSAWHESQPDAPPELGRQAESPAEIPPKGWFQVLKRVKRESVADNASLLAGGVAFFALLAIVPLLVAGLAIWGLFANPSDATRLIRDIVSGLPHSAQRLVSEQLRSIAGRSNAGLSITAAVSLVIALWSASSGTKHLIEAVNAAYDEEDDRHFVKVRGLACCSPSAPSSSDCSRSDSSPSSRVRLPTPVRRTHFGSCSTRWSGRCSPR